MSDVTPLFLVSEASEGSDLHEEEVMWVQRQTVSRLTRCQRHISHSVVLGPAEVWGENKLAKLRRCDRQVKAKHLGPKFY